MISHFFTPLFLTGQENTVHGHRFCLRLNGEVDKVGWLLKWFVIDFYTFFLYSRLHRSEFTHNYRFSTEIGPPSLRN